MEFVVIAFLQGHRYIVIALASSQEKGTLWLSIVFMVEAEALSLEELS